MSGVKVRRGFSIEMWCAEATASLSESTRTACVRSHPSLARRTSGEVEGGGRTRCATVRGKRLRVLGVSFST